MMNGSTLTGVNLTIKVSNYKSKITFIHHNLNQNVISGRNYFNYIRKIGEIVFTGLLTSALDKLLCSSLYNAGFPLARLCLDYSAIKMNEIMSVAAIWMQQ